MTKGNAYGKVCSGYLGSCAISKGYSGAQPRAYSLFSKPYGKIGVGYNPFQMFERNNAYRNMAPTYSGNSKYGAGKSKPVKNYSSRPTNFKPQNSYQNRNRSIDKIAEEAGGHYPGKEYAREALLNSPLYAPNAPDIGDFLQSLNFGESYINKAKCPICGMHPLKCLCNPLMN